MLNFLKKFSTRMMVQLLQMLASAMRHCVHVHIARPFTSRWGGATLQPAANEMYLRYRCLPTPPPAPPMRGNPCARLKKLKNGYWNAPTGAAAHLRCYLALVTLHRMIQRELCVRDMCIKL